MLRAELEEVREIAREESRAALREIRKELAAVKAELEALTKPMKVAKKSS